MNAILKNAVNTWEPRSIINGGDATARGDSSHAVLENIGSKKVPCTSSTGQGKNLSACLYEILLKLFSVRVIAVPEMIGCR